MIINKSKLIGLSVFTQMGEPLGKVGGFEIDTDTHKIERYHIKSRDLIKELFGHELIVSASQVISISEEKMIVEDGVIKDKQVKKARLKQAALVN